MSKTIVAVGTSLASSAGINIIRVSGDEAKSIADKIFRSKNIPEQGMVPNVMYLGQVIGEYFNERAFCVYFKTPFSYTGEDVIEIHCHGGIGVTQAILRLICENGARPAEPGEFTRRAFLNGKLSLAEAEGVLDMINASSESEIRKSYRLMNGELTEGIDKAEKLLTETCAMLEAKIDYPEELEEDTKAPAKINIEQMLVNLKKVLDNTKRAKLLTNGIDIAIVGVPNAGKSSLLNALLNEDRAIVSDIAGTTRDVVKERIEIDGMKINFLDTAGIREGKDKIEIMGIERSKKAVNQADLVIDVHDSSQEISNEEREIEKLLEGKKVIHVCNKTDITKYPREGIQISVKEKTGLETLIKEIMNSVGRKEIYTEGVITNERQICALREAYNAIENAYKGYDFLPTECTLDDLKTGLKELGKITGHNVSEDIIDEVFSRFCVGK